MLPTSHTFSVNKKGFSASARSEGFTLVELLVVIAIIAVLAAIGFTVYSGIQPKARNDRRKADLDAIAKALEVNKTATGYIALANSQFSAGSIPLLDPQGLVYCGNTTVNTQPGALTAVSTASVCTPSGAAGYSPISTSIPLAGTSWQICTWLEAEGVTVAQSYCRKSAQ